MNTGDHHQDRLHAPQAARIEVLTDLLAFIDASTDIPARRKPHLRSAVRRVNELVGTGLAGVPADPKAILRKLQQISPAMAGRTRQSMANLKSNLRYLLRQAHPQLARARSDTKLEGAWKTFWEQVPRESRWQLSRFCRFAQDMGWSPEDIGNEHMERFLHYLEHQAVLSDPRSKVHETRAAWNRALGLQQVGCKVALLPRKKGIYWLKPDQLPDSLRQEIDVYLDRLEHPDPFDGSASKGLAPATILQFRYMFITLASALVARGTPVEALTSIGTLIQPDNLKMALGFLHQRAGGRVSETVYQVAYRARSVARYSDMPKQDVDRIDQMLSSIKAAYGGRSGLTVKNRKLVDHLEDPAFVDRLLAFPSRLTAAARAATNDTWAAIYVRDAVAVELLLTCSMRVGNLVDLRVGETIRRYGEKRSARWVIDVPAEKVKNQQPLRFTLLPETGRLIQEYLAQWHPHLGPANSWLFPATDGSHIKPAVLSQSIAKRAWRFVGVRITAHQFRHLAAELYLREDPSGLYIVSQHLGHRNFNTTRNFYAREQSQASERYHAVLLRKRATARPQRRQRREAR